MLIGIRKLFKLFSKRLINYWIINEVGCHFNLMFGNSIICRTRNYVHKDILKSDQFRVFLQIQ